jgi:hypothetical protein
MFPNSRREMGSLRSKSRAPRGPPLPRILNLHTPTCDLVHSKFHNADACQNFASSYLNFYAPVSDDFTESDDLFSFQYAPEDDHSENEEGSDNEDYDDDNGGSYGDGGGGEPQVLAHRDRHRAARKAPPAVAAAAETLPTAAAAVAESAPAASAAVGAPAQVDRAARNSVADTANGGNSPLRNVQLLRDAEQAQREYAFTQLRNNVCTYDEKYGLWVKTSCHGELHPCA